MKTYSIHQFGDLLRDAEPLSKARPKGGGWFSIGKKGGMARVRGGKREYWYPSADEAPKKAKKKSKKAKPTTPAISPEYSKPMEAIASQAPKGSAKWKLETGKFKLIRKRVFHRDQDDHQRATTTWAPFVDDKTKMEIIKDYNPLVYSLARKLSRQYHLAWTKEVRTDLQSAGVEGLLVAIDKYKGGTAFDPSLVVKDMMRVHAAKEFLGFDLPKLHARNVARYIAARHQAAKKLDIHDPSPEEVLPFFDLRKRHVHDGLPAYDESRKVGVYPKMMNKFEEDDEGRQIVRRVKHPKAGEPRYAPLRNEQIPDFEGYTFPEYLGRKGADEDPSDRKRKQQPSKLDWAEMYHGFLKGQKGLTSFDAQVIAPGAGIGYGFSVEDQLVIRHDLADAADRITKMGPATVSEKSYPGAKSETEYRVKDLGDIVMRRLGVNQEEHSVKALVRAVPIQKKTKDGKWKRVGDRQAESLMQKFVEMGMEKLPKQTDGPHAKRLAERAKNILAPTKTAPSGPSWVEVIQKEAASYKQPEIDKFRKEYDGPEANRVGRMNDDEIRIVMAKQSRTGRKLSREIRAAMLAHMSIERVDPQYGIARRVDPDTGEWESVKVRMNYERRFKKSFDTLSDSVLRQIDDFPNLMLLLTSDGPPSLERAALERMIGLG